MKILHFAIENFARVPGNLVRAERELGHDSYLMTLYPTSHRFQDEDYCLRMPFVGSRFIDQVKAVFRSKQSQSNKRKEISSGMPVWSPKNKLIRHLIDLRDGIWEGRVRKALASIDIHTFDLIWLDGGLGFLRSGKIVNELKQSGCKIGILYCGSDFRTRGVIPAVDDLADARFTVEYDHTLLDPTLQFLYFPFKLPDFKAPLPVGDSLIRIGHAPTNRAVKGTDQILKELEPLKRSHSVEIILIEGLAHQDALVLKKTCDIFIDNIGELGYGINGLESLAMGIPTAVQLLPDFEKFLGNHPFINISRNRIAEKLVPYLESESLRRQAGTESLKWVGERHNPLYVSRQMLSSF